jgi:anti-sigma-K factor RskA
MDQEKLKELAAAYCLGALDGDEKRLFEELLQKGDPLARQVYREMQETASLLPYAAEPVPPPAYLKENILQRIGAETARPKTPIRNLAETSESAIFENLQNLVWRWKRLAWGITFASVLLLAGLSWYFLEREKQIFAEKNQKITEMQTRLEDFEITLREKDRLLQLVKAYENAIFALNRLGSNLQNANVKVVIVPDQNKAVFIGSDIVPPPPGKVYLLWKLQGASPINAGVWQTDAQGNLVYEVGDITDDITDFAVTIESGETAQSLTGPTSPIELHVKI